MCVSTNLNVGMFNVEINIQKQDKRSGKSTCTLPALGDVFVPFFVDLIVGHCFLIIYYYSELVTLRDLKANKSLKVTFVFRFTHFVCGKMGENIGWARIERIAYDRQNNGAKISQAHSFA